MFLTKRLVPFMAAVVGMSQAAYIDQLDQLGEFDLAELEREFNDIMSH